MELLTNSATPGQDSPLCSLLEPIQTTPAPGTVETYAVSAPAPFSLRLASGVDAAQFRVVIDGEYMIVTAKADGSSPWSFERGAENSPPATHPAGSSVFYTLTAGAVAATVGDQISDIAPGDIGAATVAAVTTAQTTAAAAGAVAAAEVTRAQMAEATLVPLAQKGVASGVGTLDSGGHQPLAQVAPSVANGRSLTVASLPAPTGVGLETILGGTDAAPYIEYQTYNGVIL